MKITLVDEYTRIFSLFMKGGSERERIQILSELEKISDDTSDVMTQFLENNGSPPYPKYWIAVLRIIKFSLNLKSELLSGYDGFVITYQKLNAASDLTQDQSRLLHETGEFLYNTDEITGFHERCIAHCLEVTHQCLLEEFGVTETNHTMYSFAVSRENGDRIYPHIHELYQIIIRIQKQIRIMEALNRMIRLIG